MHASSTLKGRSVSRQVDSVISSVRIALDVGWALRLPVGITWLGDSCANRLENDPGFSTPSRPPSIRTHADLRPQPS